MCNNVQELLKPLLEFISPIFIMRTIFAILLAFVYVLPLSAHEQQSKTVSTFHSFIRQFARFNKSQIDSSFFCVREKRGAERFSPELDRTEYSAYLSCIKLCECEVEGLYYKPCHHIDTEQFILLAVNAVCDTPVSNYPFEASVLITYDKSGGLIDCEVLGCIGDVLYYKIDGAKGFLEFTYTQYSFCDTTETYSGKCDVEIYKVVINNNGTIDKTLVNSYCDDITIAL